MGFSLLPINVCHLFECSGARVLYLMFQYLCMWGESVRRIANLYLQSKKFEDVRRAHFEKKEYIKNQQPASAHTICCLVTTVKSCTLLVACFKIKRKMSYSICVQKSRKSAVQAGSYTTTTNKRNHCEKKSQLASQTAIWFYWLGYQKEQQM